jgi:hypothetical protein
MKWAGRVPLLGVLSWNFITGLNGTSAPDTKMRGGWRVTSVGALEKGMVFFPCFQGLRYWPFCSFLLWGGRSTEGKTVRSLLIRVNILTTKKKNWTGQ